MDYSKTLNLPETNFPLKPEPARTELEILSIWENLKPYEERQRLNKGNPRYLVYNSLNSVNDHVCLDNALNMILKDVMVKYKLMGGLNAPHLPGWNCHTSAIEREALELLKSKNGIQPSGVRKRCRDRCSEYVDLQKKQYKRLGIFAHWNKAVLTSDANYGSKMIKAFADLYEAGYLYKSAKPMRWCISCQTDLVKAEIEYRDRELMSLYVKFPVLHGLEELGEDVYMVVWTNTPWTLPANTAIIVHPDYEYAAVEIGGGEILVMAADAVKDVVGRKKGTHKVVRKMKGLELDKIVYAHPFLDRNSDVLLDRSVSLAHGTGCTHTVPECGGGVRAHQGAEFVSAVDQNGQLTERAGQFCSYNVFESIDLISLELEKRGCLLSAKQVKQAYPHCSYCKEPTIVRVADKWVFNLNANELRQRILEVMDGLDWSPGWSKNRITDGIAERSDWSISRQRKWGIPAPIFYCNKCGSQVDALESISSSRDMIERRGTNRWLAAKPGDILPEKVLCSSCGGRDFRWETEMLDTEFMSAMSHSIISCSNGDSFQAADVCLGNNGQDEKLFQLLLLPSIAIEDSLPFKSVLLHGAIVDGEGKTIPKSENDTLSLENLLDNFGAEILRFWAISMDSGKHLKMSHSWLEEVSKSHQRIRNTCRFLLANLSGYDPETDRVDYTYLQEIDRWALHRLMRFVDGATKALENSQFHLLYHLLHDFCSVDMSSLYLNIVKRRLYTFPRWSSNRRAAQTVLYESLTVLVRVMAPILSFTAEEIWRQIPGVAEEYPSVFLSDWPDVNESLLDDGLEARWDQLLKIRSQIYKSLQTVSQEEELSNPAQVSAILYASSSDVYNLLDRFIDDLEEIFMVSKVRLMPADSPVPDGIQESEDVKGVAVEIRRIAGERCERCRAYSDTVGVNEQYSSLCYRCIAILEGGTHYV